MSPADKIPPVDLHVHAAVSAYKGDWRGSNVSMVHNSRNSLDSPIDPHMIAQIVQMIQGRGSNVSRRQNSPHSTKHVKMNVVVAQCFHVTKLNSVGSYAICNAQHLYALFNLHKHGQNYYWPAYT